LTGERIQVVVLAAAAVAMIAVVVVAIIANTIRPPSAKHAVASSTQPQLKKKI
jgi:hypothetical protein